MRKTTKVLLMTATLATLFSCGMSESADQHHKEANTVAGRVGQAAYGAAKETDKAAKVAGKELSKAAHEAHEGWKEAAQKDKAKQ
jgi:hypothetical protein